jgi:hypothetical protein
VLALVIFERMDSLHPNTPLTQSSTQKSAWKTNQSPTPAPTRHNWLVEVHQLLHFMHEHFADVINVAGDGYCGFCVVSHLIGLLNYYDLITIA